MYVNVTHLLVKLVDIIVWAKVDPSPLILKDLNVNYVQVLIVYMIQFIVILISNDQFRFSYVLRYILIKKII